MKTAHHPIYQTTESDLTCMSGESLLMLAIRMCKNQSISNQIHEELESRSHETRCEHDQRQFLFSSYLSGPMYAN